MALTLASRIAAIAYLLVAFVTMLTACDDTQSVDRMQRAQEFLDGGRPNGAVVELKKLLQDDPRNAEGRRPGATSVLARLSDGAATVSLRTAISVPVERLHDRRSRSADIPGGN